MMDTKVGTSKKDDPADVAETGFKAMMKGEGVVVSGWHNKLRTAIASVTTAGMLGEQHRRIASMAPLRADRDGPTYKGSITAPVALHGAGYRGRTVGRRIARRAARFPSPRQCASRRRPRARDADRPGDSQNPRHWPPGAS